MNILELARFEELNGENFIDRPCDISILVNVYNFGNFLKETFEGILEQDTDFSMEVLVHDDASTDESQDIVREYCEKYPNLFHGFIGHKNVYGTLSDSKCAEFENEWIRQYANGKYFAYCEGDDFWTDKDKIQVQLSYMIKHPECKLTMHDAIIWDYRNESRYRMKEGEPDHDLLVDELIMQKTGIWPTASMIFSKDVALSPKWMTECWVGDWPRQLYAIANGTVHFFGKAMSVYRYMHSISWSKRTSENIDMELKHCLQMMHFLVLYDNYTNGQNHDDIVERCGGFYLNLIGKVANYSDLISMIKKMSKDIRESFTWEIEQLESICKLLKCEECLPQELEKFVSEQKEFYIYGNGNNAHLLSEKLIKKGINFNGYVVSDNEIISLDVSNVFHISDIKDKNIPFAVGVGPQHYKAIKKVLEDCKAKYIFPFVISDFPKVRI